MRPGVIVVGAPCRNHAAGLAQRREQVFVEAFLAHPSVEVFDQTVLHRLAWGDVLPVDLTVLLPFEHLVAGQSVALASGQEIMLKKQCLATYGVSAMLKQTNWMLSVSKRNDKVF